MINGYSEEQIDFYKGEALAAWLKANPEIGELNSGVYYRIVDGQEQFVAPLEGHEMNPGLKAAIIESMRIEREERV